MLTVSKVKTFMGMDTQGFNCMLHFKGEKVASVVNDGGGGETMYHFVSREAEAAVLEYAKGLNMPNWALKKEDFPDGLEDKNGRTRLDDAVEIAMGDEAMKKKVKRAMKTKTLFNAPGDKEKDIAYRTLNMPWGPAAKKVLEEKFPGQKLHIYNEE